MSAAKEVLRTFHRDGRRVTARQLGSNAREELVEVMPDGFCSRKLLWNAAQAIPPDATLEIEPGRIVCRHRRSHMVVQLRPRKALDQVREVEKSPNEQRGVR